MSEASIVTRWIPLSEVLTLLPCEVEDYTYKKYPGERVLVEGLLEVFTALSDDLLFLIFSDNHLLKLLIRVTKHMNEKAFPLFYATVGQLPLSRCEIVDTIKRN